MSLPSLFPVPAQVDSVDETVRAAGPVVTVHDPGLPAQGYDLRVDADGVRLVHADDAGRRYGTQTVGQLRRRDGTLPGVHVADRPDVPVRGYMLDVSRDRVPTRATLARLVDVLSVCRYNHLQLYVEHTVAYAGHEDAWRDASPLTLDDLAWLDDLCAAAGIELAANQNCFGHMGQWLRHDRYRARAECPDGFDVTPGVHLPPAVLAPIADNAEFALGLVREQMGAVRSRRVNVGCDETFELGRGASRERAAAVGVETVYLEHLRRIVEPLLADGCAVQFWGDVLGHHPDLVGRLPGGDLTALVWSYEAPDAPVPDMAPDVRAVVDQMGFDLRGGGFTPRVAPFADAGVPFWVVPGTSTWASFVGRLDNARANLLDAATVAARSGAGGMLVTDWGDGGHHHPPSVSLPPIAYGGAVAWCAANNRDVDVPDAIDRLLVDDPTGTVGRVLDAVGRVAGRTGMVASNASPLLAALLPHQWHLVSGQPDPDAIEEVIAVLDRAADDLGRARPAAVDGPLIVDELEVAIGLARSGAVRLAERAGVQPPDPVARRAELSRLVERYRAAWLARSRPGGLDASVAHLERTRRRDAREGGTV